MNYLTPVLFVVVTLCQLSCNKDADPKKEFVTLDNITLELISNETLNKNFVVENFSLLSVEVTEIDGNEFYALYYSFDIRNTGSAPLLIPSTGIQNIFFKDEKSIGAGGTTISGATIPPGEKYTVTYSANSSLLASGLAIEGWTWRIKITPFLTLEYLVHINE
jgi:hypothetical protein